MKLKKIVAAIAAAAVAVSTMAFSAFAAQSEKIEAVKLDSASEEGKIIQWPINAFADFSSITKVTVKGTASVADWCGGGGALGFDSVDGWKQIDFDITKNDFVTCDQATGEFTAELDFGGVALDFDKADGVMQVGWWWGSGDGSMQLSDVLVDGTSILGLAGTFQTEEAAPAEETAEEAAADEEVAAPAEEEVVADEAPAEEAPAAEEAVEEAPAADAEAATAPAATGNTTAAVIVSVMAVAAAAAVVAKKRK